MEKNNSTLFYTCSLIEYLGRETRNKRADILEYLGKENITRIYEYADVFHCEPIAKVADDFIQIAQITDGSYDNVAACHYTVPDYWDIGDVFSRLLEDSYEEAQVIDGIFEVYGSWIADAILNFNSDFFYQPRDYIAACYREGTVLA